MDHYSIKSPLVLSVTCYCCIVVSQIISATKIWHSYEYSFCDFHPSKSLFLGWKVKKKKCKKLNDESFSWLKEAIKYDELRLKYLVVIVCIACSKLLILSYFFYHHIHISNLNLSKFLPGHSLTCFNLTEHILRDTITAGRCSLFSKASSPLCGHQEAYSGQLFQAFSTPENYLALCLQIIDFDIDICPDFTAWHSRCIPNQTQCVNVFHPSFDVVKALSLNK